MGSDFGGRSQMNFRSCVRDELAKYKTIAVWGTGSSALQAMRSWLPDERISYFIDSNRALWGTEFKKRNIHSPAEAIADSPDCIIVCTSAYAEVLDELAGAKFTGKAIYAFDLLENAVTGAALLSEFDMLKFDIAVQKDRGIYEFLLLRPQILVNISFRLTRHFLKRKPFWLFGQIMRFFHSFNCAFFSISLPVEAEVGPGLYFPHYGAIVIHPKSKLGAFCTLYQGVTIGSVDDGATPVLGNYVTAYARSSILGDSHIGDNTRIGAHTLIIDMSPPPYCSVVGNPARVVNSYENLREPADMAIK